MEEITLAELQPGMILLLSGTKFLAKKIQWFQKLKYGKTLKDGTDSYWYLNHAGHIDKDIDGDAMVYEENVPGKYMEVRLDEDYLKEKSNVYIGVPVVNLSPSGLHILRERAEVLAGSTKILDYSYKSFFSFMADAVWYKLFKKNIWVTGEPKGATCSQIVAKLFQEIFGMFMEYIWYSYFPCMIAQSKEITVKKLIY